MTNKIQLAVLMVALLASNAMAKQIDTIQLKQNDKKVRELIEKQEEGKKVIVRSAPPREGLVLSFIAYFCDWNKGVIAIDMELGAGAICIFKVNDSIDEYFSTK